MTREQFKQNIAEAIDFHDGYISDEDLERLLDLNYDEDSSITGWTYSDFNAFAVDYNVYGIRYACRYSDLKWDDEEEDDE